MVYVVLALVWCWGLFSAVFPERAARINLAGTLDTYSERFRDQCIWSMRLLGIGIIVGLPIVLIDVWPSN